MTTAGIIGHMHWKHGKDYKAPLLDKPKPMGVQEARRKANDLDKVLDKLMDSLSPGHEAYHQAQHLAHLRDIGVPQSEMKPYAEASVKHIVEAKKVSYDEAIGLLHEAVKSYKRMEERKSELSGRRKR
jgi:hypothetical protein